MSFTFFRAGLFGLGTCMLVGSGVQYSLSEFLRTAQLVMIQLISVAVHS